MELALKGLFNFGEGDAVMPKRRRIKQTVALGDRLGARAIQLRAEAAKLPHGSERADLLRLARQAEAAADMSEWLKPAHSQAPR